MSSAVILLLWSALFSTLLAGLLLLAGRLLIKKPVWHDQLLKSVLIMLLAGPICFAVLQAAGVGQLFNIHLPDIVENTITSAPVSDAVAEAGALSASSPIDMQVLNLVEMRQNLVRFLAPLLVLIWLLGACVAGVRLYLRLRNTRRLLAATLPVEDERCIALFRSVAASMAVPRMPRLVCSCDGIAPFAAGNIVSIPRATLNKADDDELQAIFSHELMHIRRRDALWMVYCSLMCTIYWWQPLVRLVTDRLNETAELNCDRGAMAVTGDADSLLKAILRSAESLQRQKALVPGMSSTPSLIQLRAREILKCEAAKEQPSIARVSIWAPLGVLLSFIFVMPGFSLNTGQGSVVAEEARVTTRTLPPGDFALTRVYEDGIEITAEVRHTRVETLAESGVVSFTFTSMDALVMVEVRRGDNHWQWEYTPDGPQDLGIIKQAVISPEDMRDPRQISFPKALLMLLDSEPDMK